MDNNCIIEEANTTSLPQQVFFNKASITGIPRNSQPSQFANSQIRNSTCVYRTSQFAKFVSQVRNFEVLFNSKNAIKLNFTRIGVKLSIFF